MKRLIYAITFFLITISLFAQPNTKGTDFWMGFMENLTMGFNDAPRFSFIITSEVATSGTISIPTTGLTIPFSVIANEATEFFMPDAIYYTSGSDVVDNKGIRIVSNDPISVQAIHYRLYFSEATQILPLPELGTAYLMLAATEFTAAPFPSELVIVSTADGTTIEITPSTLTLGLHPADVPYTITLNAGQNYQIQALGDLTGTLVTANQPIAVFGGAVQANIGCSGPDTSHLYDQNYPISAWDTVYVFVPFSNQGGDPIKIIASEDNTLVKFDCEDEVVLNRGEYYETTLNAVTYITADFPISIAQFNKSQDCNLGSIGGPSMLTLTPALLQTHYAGFEALDTEQAPGNFYTTLHYCNIVMLTNDVGSMLLDGASIASNFSPVPGNPYFSYAQIDLSAQPGVHLLESANGFQAYSYGFGLYDAYTFHLGYDEKIELPEEILEMEVVGALCVDSMLVFSLNTNIDFSDYSWTFGDGGVATSENPTYIYTSEGTYEVNLLATAVTGCTFETSLTLNIENCEVIEPILEIEVTGSACIDSILTFSTTTNLTDATFEWTFGDGGFSNVLNPTYIYTAAGVYDVVLTATTPIGEVISASVMLTIEDCEIIDPEIMLQINGDACIDSTLQFTILSNIVLDNWSWSFGDNSMSTAESPSYSYMGTGFYEIIFSTVLENGDVLSKDTTIQITACGIDPACQFIVPTAFSPNDDGLNDVFRPFLDCPSQTDYHFQVYNRWGQRIFETTDPTQSWDGLHGRFQSPIGVYVWFVRYYKLTENGEVTLEVAKGNVTLVR